MSLLAELKQRKLVQWLLAYSAGAWVLLQVIGLIGAQFGWPPGLMRGITIAAGIGFFVALLLAWYHGERGAQKVSGTELLLLTLLLAIGGGLLWKFAPEKEKGTEGIKPNLITSVPFSAPSLATTAPGKSIAVLAFTDLSPKHDQDYFSDGMAEELLNALAQVKDLKVAGRTSSFYYKGRNEDLRAIGAALGVANVLEGSVRTQGDKVRITAQLVRSVDGFHLWSDSYDGDLKDVFALQEKIARAITDELQVVLQGEQKTRLVPVATTSPEAYSLYLQATAIFNRRDGAQFQVAIDDLRDAIRLDPKYARAYSRLATMYVVLPSYTDADVGQARGQIIKNAELATALDPTLAEPWAAKGQADSQAAGHLVEQRQSCDRALQLDPEDSTANFWCGLTSLKTGYWQRGTALIQHALEIDPLLPNVLRWRAKLYYFDGDLDRAEALLVKARDGGLVGANRELGDIASERGDAAKAATLWATGARILTDTLSDAEMDTLAKGLYGDAAARAQGINVVDAYLARPHEHVHGIFPPAMARLGDERRSLEIMRTQVINDNTDFMGLLWSSHGKAMRQMPEFQTLMRDFGYFSLWDKYGPPDACRKDGKGGYACD